jgi:predicted CXXCH cytochrome family protein
MDLSRLNVSSRLIAICLCAAALVAGCDSDPDAERGIPEHAATDSYVGATVCADCHESEAALWQGSHHDLAMQVANTNTVLGDFADSEYEHNGVLTRFFSEDNSLWVETDGPDGELAKFPVAYAFGVYPLQQYLLKLPSGKLQALDVSWDSRPAEAGGQRWFHLQGDEAVDSNDILHWTKPSHNWETMCADCHSTALLSEYSLAEDKFTTHWSELNVACEACHGPGAKHVAWADGKSEEVSNMGLDLLFAERRDVGWVPDPDTGISQRSEANAARTEINACAGCHSRRTRIAEDVHPATPFLDTYIPALVDEPLYQGDGQILDEVYVYGSFLQSKMYAAGVTCSDCHDPHSLELRAPGAAVCGQCHDAQKFAGSEHQMHAADVVDCLDCHMAAATYMQVDPRRDHSFRIPRPALTASHGVANACSNCHADESADWLIQSLAAAGRLSLAADASHWTARLAGANQINFAAMEDLTSLALDESVPVIIRATATARMRLGNTPAARALMQQLAMSDEPLIRLGLARALQNSQPQLVAALAPGLLDDELRAVRIEAASALAGLDPVLLPAGSQASVKAGLDEYMAAQIVNAERPESYVNMANIERQQGRLEKAEQGYRTAIVLRPEFVPAYVNLADLYRDWGREADAESVLLSGLLAVPEQAPIHHALGLSLVRQQRLEEALPELKLAAESPDATARFAWVYAVALQSNGNIDEAIQFLEGALQRFAGQPELVTTLREYRAQQNLN